MRRGRHLLLAGSAIAFASAAGAGERIGYRYDSLGRLIQVKHCGSANNGLDAQYSYDSADNRSRVTVSAPPAPPSPPPPPPPPTPPPTTC
jgi:hypothetical protein